MAFHRLLLALGLTATALCSPLDAERIWTGKNGTKIRGTRAMLTPDGKSLNMEVMGKIRTIALANLSQADQDFVRGCTEGTLPRPDKAPQSGDPAAFITPKALDRNTLPLLNQGEFGRKQSDCVPSSFCNFLLWWDQQNLLAIPKRGDFEEKAEWVHTRMARYCETRNTAGTNVESAVEGFAEYFTKEIPDLATLRSKTDHDISPANLARYTVGENATMLEITTRKKSGADGSHWVALLSAEAGGRVVIHTWGSRFEGVIKVLEENKEVVIVGQQQVPKTSYEIEFTNRESLPQWVRDAEMRFLLLPQRRDGITVVRPYCYKTAGKASPPPPDPLLDEVRDRE